MLTCQKLSQKESVNNLVMKAHTGTFDYIKLRVNIVIEREKARRLHLDIFIYSKLK